MLTPARPHAPDTATVVKQLYELRTRVGMGSGAPADPWASGIDVDTKRATAHLPENTDQQELVTSTGFQVLGLYSTMVACLLTIFIQQTCSTTECTGIGASRVCTTTEMPCTFGQNLNATGFGRVVVAFNFTTLAMFMVSNLVFFFRERWCVSLQRYHSSSAHVRPLAGSSRTSIQTWTWQLRT